MLRGYGATGSAQLPNGYRLDIPSGSNTMSLKKMVNSTVSTLGSFNYSGPLDASPVRVRFRVDGSKISVKVWAAGTLEPAAWSLERTDSTITAAGTLQIAQSYQSGSGRVIYVDNVTYQNRSYWGVDSVNGVDQTRLNYVKNNYGNPVYWGRYLHDDENPHPTDHNKGLNQEPGHQNEVAFLAANHIPVWVIDYNPGYRDLVAEPNGRSAEEMGRHSANLAITHATDLGIPKTVALFADVEPNEPGHPLVVDKDWIWGWWSQIHNAGWEVGFYGNPRGDNNFILPFCTAAGLHPEMRNDTYMWSQQPHTGRTREANARPYQGEDFDCGANGFFPALGHQYGIGNLDSDQQRDPDLPEEDFYDTDLIRPDMLDVLWYPGGVHCPGPRGPNYGTCYPQ